MCGAMGTKGRKCCSMQSVKRFFPISSWLPTYRPRFLVDDLVAGLTVGLTAVAQGIAYGAIAGLPPVYGLYSAFMGSFTYIIFGTCKDITVGKCDGHTNHICICFCIYHNLILGPTAIISMMVSPHINGNPDFAVLLCFLSGLIIFVLGLLNLGVLMRFISVPVTTGFTMAAALTVGSGQINNLFGIQSNSNEFLKSWINFFSHIKETRRNDAILGWCTLIFLLCMRVSWDLN